MQDILQQLIPLVQPQERSQLLLNVANSCSSYEDVLIFSALCRQFPIDSSEPLEAVIHRNIKTITKDSIKIVAELIQGPRDARGLAYKCLESELRTDDHYRLQELLEFTYEVSIRDSNPIPDFFIDKLWSFLLCDEDIIVNLVSRILNIKKYNGSTENWFKSIKQRILSTALGEVPAYKCWLSWLRQGPRSGHLIKALHTDEYWQLIQRGITLVPRSTERIKYCLAILDLSLRDLQEPLGLSIMKWNPQSKLCRSLWTRFVALAEIISVDLSHNQAEESRGDIIALCQTSQFIPTTWALALLQSGLTTSAENIRNFILEVVFALPNRDLFNADPGFLVSYLLPLASDASKFNVESQQKCVYIETLAEFVSGAVDALEPPNRAAFLEQLLKVYQAQVYAYDFPRVVILDALLSFQIPASIETFTELANYANSARRVSKSQVVGQMIFDTCIKALKSLNNIQRIELLPKFFGASSYDRLDLAVAYIENDEGTRRQLAQLAQQSATYYIAYHKLSQKYSWPALELLSHPEPVQIVNALGDQFGRKFEQTLCEFAATEFKSLGYFREDTMDALLICGSCPLVQLASPTGTEELLGQSQLQRLSESAKKETSFEKLQIIVNSGYQSGSERALNAQRITHTVARISPQQRLGSERISTLERCFGYDYVHSQTSVLRCILRYLDSDVPLDLVDLAQALVSMWELLIENGLKAISRDLHLEFISVFMHSRLFWCKEAAPHLETIASSVVSSSHARKNLLCPLIRAIKEKLNEKPQLPIWACKTLVEAYTLIRTRHNVFYLEGILKQKYLPRSSTINARFWPENERHARALAIQTLATQQDQAEAIAETIIHDESEYHLFSAINYHDGVEENVRILCFQVLVLVHTGWSAQFFEKLLPYLTTAVDQEGSKIARVYIEWLLASFSLQNKPLIHKLILDPLRNSQEPRFVSSLGRAGLLVAKAMGKNTPPSYLTEFLNVMLPLSTSNKAAIRHFSVAMIYAIHLDSELEPLLGESLRQIVKGISECAESSDQFRNFKQGDDCVWSIHDEQTLEGICGGVITKLYQYNPLYCLRPSELDLETGCANSAMDSCHNLAKLANMTTIRDAILTENIQTKASTEQETNRTELVVVASLCDIAVNLGGICRLSDALGVKMLAVNDLGVVKNPHFKNTCVTADRWQPMCQVKEDEIIEYMLEKKQQGYTLIGLEQTDNSKMLGPSLEFPSRSLLLIGRERQGIPSHLLVHLDFCVEIEQWGVVRSMNVQTATAVIVHAYNNQRS